MGGNQSALDHFSSELEEPRRFLGFGITTGRSLDSALEKLREFNLPMPDILIARVGTEIYYGKTLLQDRQWERHIDHDWQPEAVREAMNGLSGVKIQEAAEQGRFKVSFLVDSSRDKPRSRREIVRHLRKAGLRVNVIFSYGKFIDVLPVRASTGLAVRYLAFKWNVRPDSILIGGFSGREKEMLLGDTLGVVVGKHSPELRELKGQPRIYFAKSRFADGLLEGIEHYNFFGGIKIPGEDEDDYPVRGIPAPAS